jgi:hypothetical protein
VIGMMMLMLGTPYRTAGPLPHPAGPWQTAQLIW